ncbi:hypothetical protein BDF21DRAFT_413683 [Thamnidium elegans]|nr:hypothetical protein BDF21DRAFT_413683 [Thamnidium elegans]
MQDLYNFYRGDKTLLSRVNILRNNEVLIDFSLVQIANSLFGFPESKFFPKVLKTDSIYITPQDFENDIRLSLTAKMISSETGVDSYQIEDNIVEEIYNGMGFKSKKNEGSLCGLEDNKILKEYKDINAKFGLCDGIKNKIGGIVKRLFPSNIGKEYDFLTIMDRYSFGSQQNSGLAEWVNSIQVDIINSISTEPYDVLPEDSIFYIKPNDMFSGAFFAAFETIKNGDMYCPPRIIDRGDLDVPLSVFLNCGPDAIMHIDISFECTRLSLSLLNSNGLVERIFDHNYFTSIKWLHSLSSFYVTLSEEERTLNYIFTKNDTVRENGFIADFLSILSHCSPGNKGVFPPQLEYRNKYLLLYLAHINDIISSGWPKDLDSNDKNLKVGYTVSIEKIMLDNLVGRKQDFEELIHTSGLVTKNEEFKKLIVVTKGEGVLPVIQRYLKLDFPLRSNILLAQLYEGYIQLTINQVVTSTSLDENEQESIIYHDEIIPIRNLYESLCLNMLEHIINYTYLIHQCDLHHGDNDSDIMRLFVLKSKLIFMSNLKRFISENILANNSNLEMTHGTYIHLNNTCCCKVHLTVYDIIEVSFKPTLKEIASIVFASLLNTRLFGKYIFIDYAFTLIYFNQNPTFQSILQKILQEDAQDFNEFQGIDTECLVIPEIPNLLLQPVIKQRPFFYKAFQMGTLRQVYRKGCCFSINLENSTGLELLYKNKITDSECQSFESDSLFLLFKKGDEINNAESKRVLYLKIKEKTGSYKFEINYHECETSKENDKAVLKYDIFENTGSSYIYFDAEKYSTDGFLPVVVSFKLYGYSSSIRFDLSEVGNKTIKEKVLEAGEPLTLSRL